MNPLPRKNVRRQSPRPPHTSGQGKHQPHSTVSATQKYHEHGKPSSDWSSDSVSETEFTPQGFERHPSNPYYIGKNKDRDDPDISLHAQDDSFDEDGDPAFTPEQISILKSTMMDIQENSRIQRSGSRSQPEPR